MRFVNKILDNIASWGFPLVFINLALSIANFTFYIINGHPFNLLVGTLGFCTVVAWWFKNLPDDEA